MKKLMLSILVSCSMVGMVGNAHANKAVNLSLSCKHDSMNVKFPVNKSERNPLVLTMGSSEHPKDNK